MMKISVAFLAAMSLAALGCHKDKELGSVAKLTEIKGKMCACKDKTCSDKVSEELVQWGQQQEKAAGDKSVALSESDTEKVEKVKEEIARCLLKLEVPGGDGAPPAGAAGDTMGRGSPAPGAADGPGAARGGADGAAAGGAGAAAPGSAAAGSAH